MPAGPAGSRPLAEGLVQEVSNQLGVSMRAADALIGLAEEPGDPAEAHRGRRWRPG